MKKKILGIVVLLTIIVSVLASCSSISKSELVGEWEASYYYDGNYYVNTLVFDSDETYRKVVKKNSRISSTETGTYEIKSGKVVIHENGASNIRQEFEYIDDALVNNDVYYYKQ